MGTPRAYLKFCIYSLLLLYSRPCECRANRPNIVFILADDLGWDDVGFHGSEIATPNIDQLAGEGVILNNYYVQPLCTPTRAAILTGKYPIHLGLQHNVILGSQPYGLPLKEHTLPQYLKSLGYQSHAVGKWHLGFFKKDYLPTQRGFDSHLGYYLGKEDYFDHFSNDDGFYGYDFHHNGKVLWNQTGTYSTELFSNHAASIIRSHNKSQPLFLYMAHQAVHVGNQAEPIEAPQKYINRFPNIKNMARRKFAGMVSALDDSVGQIYQALQESGLANNTILIFSTDNGGATNGMNGNSACNWPLRGSKKTLWQGGVRAVGFVHSPLLNHSSYINRQLMHAVDWLPTLLSAAGAEKDTFSQRDQRLDGIDQWESISHQAGTGRKEALLNIDPVSNTEGIIVGDFKLVKGRISGGRYDGWYPPPPSSMNDVFQIKKSVNNEADAVSQLLTRQSPVGKMYEYKSSSLSYVGKDELGKIISWMDGKYERYLQKLPSKRSDLTNIGFKFENNWKKSIKMPFKGSNIYRHEMDSKSKPASRPMGSGEERKVIIQCGPKPLNASTNCRPKKHPCLFHLTSDPCEYKNLAKFLPKVVAQLEKRLNVYRAGMIPPGNKPSDPRGNPQLHGGVWQPWQ